jgi:hypothetical protein
LKLAQKVTSLNGADTLQAKIGSDKRTYRK